MEQVLDNLLVNALRYVPRGGRVEIEVEAAASPGGPVRMRVGDDGPGVTPQELQHVFERFHRAAGARAADGDAGGSGLGLAIVREIVERHAGRVHAEARQPHGLDIVVELPGTAPAPGPAVPTRSGAS